MTLKLYVEIGADGRVAKAEIEGVRKSVEQTGVAAAELGTKSKAGASGVADLGGKAGAAGRMVDGLSAAERTNAATAVAMGNAHRGAAGQLGNLTAQFNDIGLMLASGQNPLQLALQQGTQITQVIGPLGAAGAVRALGGAFLQMLNPISLVTIGAIAAGAAMVGWLRDAVPPAQDAAGAIEAMKTATDSYIAASKAARRTTAELRTEYGSFAASAQADLQLAAEAQRRNDERVAADTARTLSQRAGLRRGRGGGYGIAEELGLGGTSQQARELQAKLIDPLVAAYDQLGKAADGSVQDQIAAFEELLRTFRAAASAVDGISASEDETIVTITQQLDALRRNVAEQQKAAINPDVLAFWEGVKTAASDAADTVRDRYATAVKDAATGREMLADLQAEAGIRAAILRYGENSAEVTRLRADAERTAYERQLDSLNISKELRDQILASWDNARGFASVDLSKGVAGAADQATRLADQMQRAFNNAVNISAQGLSSQRQAQIGYDYRADPVGRAGALAGAQFDEQTKLPAGSDSYLVRIMADRRAEVVKTAEETEQLRQKTIAWQKAQADAAGGAGRTTSALTRQHGAVADLIAALQDEIAITAETDPVQKELLRNRQTLAAATDAERQTISDLIAKRNADALSVQAQTDAWGLFAQVGNEALSDLISNSKSLGDVLANLTVKLLEATAQAALLGTGPLAGFFGDGSGKGGGLFGQILGAVFPGAGKAAGKASGGMIYGPGSGTSDSVPILASNGEFVVNAAATSRNRHLLEAINAGGPPRFASGGPIGSGSAASSHDGDRVIQIDARSVQGNAEIEQAIARGIRAGLAAYDRDVLPRSVARISLDGRRIG